ncbi:hypothetical protein MNBD_GAMMA12-2764 [hydrothermal vent metagenome]|uniref:DUF7939 domain-containing protein n=1 Tax=hydrothermal vent metagenome TaxID=652676 RepID=A0A3B0Z2N5_9ZZZZ
MIRFKIYRRFLLGILLCLQSTAMAVSVKVDQNTIGLNETVTLSYSVKNKGRQFSPNFSIISRDFNIVDQAYKLSYSFNNGKARSLATYVLVLKPLRKGTFTIPPMKFGSEKSASIIIKVKQRIVSNAPVSGADYFSEIVISPEKPYVQQEADMLLRIYSVQPLKMNRSDYNVDKFNISANDALLKKFASGRSYRKQLNGQVYNVYEFRYKIFPQHSGSFTIPSLKIRILKRYSRFRRYSSSRSYYSGVKFTRTKTKKVSVKARPKSSRARYWLPAVKVSLSDIWTGNPQRLYVGGSVSRTVSIEALGLMASQLPEINLNMPPGIKAYKETAVSKDLRDLEHIRSTRKIKILFLPSRAGTYTIPEIKLPWWNVKTNKIEVAILPARTLKVLDILGPATTKTPSSPKLTLPDKKSKKTGQVSTNKAVPVQSGAGYSVLWVWLSAFLLLVWLLTMLMWWLSLTRVEQDQELVRLKKKHSPPMSAILNSEQALQKSVRQSCILKQPGHCRKALLDWSRLHWPKNFPTSLTQIAERLKFADFVVQIDYLNELLYANDQNAESLVDSVVEHWDSDALWQSFSAAIKQRQSQVVKGLSPLADLYPD